MLTEEDFARTVRTYMDTVYRVAYNCLRDGTGAEDVCQEVFLRLYRSGPAFQSEEHRKRWLIRVAINEARRALASPWRRTASLDELPAEAAVAAPEDDTLPLVMSLPKKYRVVLYLY